MMKASAIVLALFPNLVLPVNATAAPVEEFQHNEFARTRTFAGRVIKIERDMRQSLNDTFVRGIPDYHRLAGRGQSNIEECIAFIADPAGTTRQKYFSILTLYGLDAGDYGVFLDGLARLARAAPINDRLILTAIRQLGYTDIVIDNYELPEIRKPLIGLMAAPGVSSRSKEWIEAVLSGKFYYRKIGIGEPPEFIYPMPPMSLLAGDNPILRRHRDSIIPGRMFVQGAP